MESSPQDLPADQERQHQLAQGAGAPESATTLDETPLSAQQGGSTLVERVNHESFSQQVLIWDFCEDARHALQSASLDRLSLADTCSKTSYEPFPINQLDQTNLFAVKLPPMRDIIHLAQIVDFHLNANHHFFNCEHFLERINQAPSISDSVKLALWKINVLQMVALGKLFLGNGATAFGPPGAREFSQAAQFLPSNSVLCQNSPIAIEILCLLATYAQAAHLHGAAYIYIGQAARLSRLCGLVDLPQDRLGSGHAVEEDKYLLGLTVRILDQRISGTIRARSEFSAEKDCSQILIAREMVDKPSLLPVHINAAIADRLAKVTAILLDNENGVTEESEFMKAITTELAALTPIGQKLHDSPLRLCEDESLVTISRSVATLHLYFYQCIMVAVKPTLVHAVQSILQDKDSPTVTNFCSNPESSILGAGCRAASFSLSIISALHMQNLLEMFSFLHLEITLLAALFLIMAGVMAPGFRDHILLRVTDTILEDMCRAGNIPCASLKGELSAIRELAHKLPPHSDDQLATQIDSFTLIRDGDTLNDAIVEVIGPLLTANQRESDELQIFHNDEEVQPVSFDTTEQMRGPSNVLQHESTDNNEPLPSNYSLDAFATMSEDFVFDIEDLQWLDTVQ